MAESKKKIIDRPDLADVNMPNERMENMLEQIPMPSPIAKAEKRASCSCKVNKDLFDTVKREREKRNIELQDIVEWGLKKWLAETIKQQKKG